jgi:hypothetical protein
MPGGKQAKRAVNKSKEGCTVASGVGFLVM